MIQSGMHSKIFYQTDQIIIEISEQTRVIFRASELPLSELALTSRQANISLLTTNNQNSVLQTSTNQHFKYGPYGQDSPIPGRSTLLGFNGQYRQLTGLYALGNGARSYSPLLMRFYSPDDLSPFDAGGLNAYAYCSGDPINFTDATGHMPRKLAQPIRRVASPSKAPAATTASGPRAGRSMISSDRRPESTPKRAPHGTAPSPADRRSSVESVPLDLTFNPVENSLKGRITQHIQQGHHVHQGQKSFYTAEYKYYNQFARDTASLILNTSKRKTVPDAKQDAFNFIENIIDGRLDPRTKAKIIRTLKPSH